MTPPQEFDFVIVGGGLQGCLLAHALHHHCADAHVLLVERRDDLCGNHTWSFHESDIPAACRVWFDPLVVHRWPSYLVKFPGFTRRLHIPYATITSDRLRDATMSLALSEGATSRNGSMVIRCSSECDIVLSHAICIDGERPISCKVIVDCRGQTATHAALRGVGYQTFVGHEFKTQNSWPTSEPTVMDVRVDQTQGFEFLYELPLQSHGVLLEYTRFHEDPNCDISRAKQLISERLHEANIGSAELVRTERGCLPMPYEAQAPSRELPVAGGYAGGWYHAATGYSMPLAVRFAHIVATSRPERINAALSAAASSDAWRRGFARFLNRLLFCLVKPGHRWKIFRRFYQVLPEERIARFYAHHFTWTDAVRIVVGRPPTGLAPMQFLRSLTSPKRRPSP